MDVLLHSRDKRNKQAAEPVHLTFRPISAYVLKIASRCNLNCKYCYMYNLADKTYLQQPSVMAKEVVDALLTKIDRHAGLHGLQSVKFYFHGGEPLLAGQDFFSSFVESARGILNPNIKPQFVVQTNATLLSLDWLELLSKLGVSVGISLDGNAEVNDANRVDHQGRGSHQKVVEAIELANSSGFSDSLRAILTVIDPASDPLETYRHFRDLGVRAADLRLPEGTYDHPPPGLTVGGTQTPYADWLIPIFDEWFANPDTTFEIRLFADIIGLIFGARNANECVGGLSPAFVVIETDGGIEPPSGLKACAEGLTKVGLNVLSNDIDDVYDDPLCATFLSGSKALCDTCKQCPIVKVCGGGKLSNRYSSVNEFDNPSIYCNDLMKLITYIQEKTVNALPEDMRAAMRLGTLAELTSE